MLAFPSKQSSRRHSIRDLRADLMPGEAAVSHSALHLARKRLHAFERACSSRRCAACRSELRTF